MDELSRQIQLLLPKEKQFLHQIYIKTIEDYAYLWEEFEDIEKLRKILLFIVKLFYIEHKGLKDLSQLDQEKFKKAFRELISNHDALLQKTRKAEIKEIEGIGAEEWLKLIKKDIMTINKIIEEYELVPERVRRGLTLNSGERYRERWSPERVRNYTLEEYIYQMKKSSEHFAVHAIGRPDLFLKCVERGFIMATGLEHEKLEGYMAAESEAVHFSVDQVYWRGISKVGFFCAIESLLENKAFMDSPLKESNSPNEDWPLGGLSKDYNDESHKFYFDNLGILVIPKKIQEPLAQQDTESWAYNLFEICRRLGIEKEFFQTTGIVLPTTSFSTEQIFKRIFEKIGKTYRKVYFYNGNVLEDGIKEFTLKYGLQPKREIIVSGSIRLVRKNQEGKTYGGFGKGDFYAVRNT